MIAGLLWIAAGAAFAQPPQLTPQTPAAQPMDNAQPSGDPLAAARRISATEARQAVEKGQAVLVDVRAKESYDLEHAQGALTLPVWQIPTRSDELPKDKLIITYCT
jgi:predicted sulfurtransferase